MIPLCSRSDLSLHLRSAEPFVEASSSRRPSFGLGAVATCPRCENAAAMLGRLYGRARVKICPTRVVQRRDSCLNVQPVHLSCWIASAGRGAGRYDAVDFRKIVQRKHNVRSAQILLEVLA